MSDQTEIDRLLRLREMARAWNACDERTAAYADLLFAFVLARRGAVEPCRRLCQEAERVLSQEAAGGANKAPTPVHPCLLRAFAYRISQALAGVPALDSLPADLFDGLDRIPRFIVDRLRQSSRVLEPHEQVDVYREWIQRPMDEANRALLGLADITSRDELANRIEQAFREADQPRHAAVVLAEALSLAACPVCHPSFFRIEHVFRPFAGTR
jgi:hypothetical protein